MTACSAAGDAAEQRERQAEQAAVAQEAATVDTAGEQHVDEVVLHRTERAAEFIEGLAVHARESLSCLVALNVGRSVHGRPRAVNRS